MSAYVHTYRTYRFINKSPAIDAVRTMLQDEHLNPHQCKELTGVTVVGNWLYGDTRDPKDGSLVALSSGLGYARHDRFNPRTGKVEVGFEKIRELDYRDEYTKQANFILKHGTAKQKAVAKKRKERGYVPRGLNGLNGKSNGRSQPHGR